MISDLVEAELESVAQARRTSPSDEGSTARGGGAPSLASMGGGPVARRTPREVGPSSGARGTMEQPPTVEDAAAPVPPAEQPSDHQSPGDHQSPEASEVPSPARRTVTTEEAVEELRRLRDEIRDLQMGHQAIAMTPPRGGGGDQYTVPIPDNNSPRGQKSPSEFLFECEQFFDASGFPLERQVPFAATLLADAAASWWRQHQTSWPTLRPDDRIVTWVQFKGALQSSFTPLTEGKVAKDRLYSLRQTGSVQAYTSLFRQLTFEIDNLAESEKFTLYERGLKGVIKTHLALARVTTLEDAMAIAESVDVALHQPLGGVEKPVMRTGGRVGGQGGGRRLGALGAPITNRHTPHLAPEVKDEAIADLLELAALVRRGNRRPDTPGESGSPAPRDMAPAARGRDMTRVRCYYCQQLGHVQWECLLKGTIPEGGIREPTGGPEGRPMSPSEEDTRSPILCIGSPIRCPKDSLSAIRAKETEEPLEFHGTLAGRRVRFLLDTGPGANFLSASVAVALGSVCDPRPVPRPTRVLLPDGTEVESKVSKALPICLRNYHEEMVFNIIRLQEFEAILGQPWLRANMALMDIGQGTVTLRPPNQATVVLTARGFPRPKELAQPPTMASAEEGRDPSPTHTGDPYPVISAMQLKKAVRKGEECFVTFLHATGVGDLHQPISNRLEPVSNQLEPITNRLDSGKTSPGSRANQ